MTAPLIVGIFHGILTGATDAAWSGACSRFILARDTVRRIVITISRDYYEFPFPRLAAVRNADRIDEINDHIAGRITTSKYRTGLDPELAFVGHSNGCVLALHSARACIADGHRVRALILMSPALRTRDTTREIAGWMRSGMLESCVLVIATGDRPLSLASALPRLVTWPWGSLGHDGWSDEALPGMRTITLKNEGHSTFLNNPEKRRGIFENIVAPLLGLA